MEIEHRPSGTWVILSKRNLLSLLAKLNGQPAGSACTIAKAAVGGSYFYVKAEEDAVHYSGRKPGPMALETEEAIKAGGSVGCASKERK